MSETCSVCGKQRMASAREKPNWLSRIGHGIAYVTVIAPFGFLLLAFPFIIIKPRPRRATTLRMCQVCEWTFGAFAVALLLIAAGIAYVVLTVPND